MSDGVCKREDLGMCDRVCKRKDERRCVVEDVRGKTREDASRIYETQTPNAQDEDVETQIHSQVFKMSEYPIHDAILDSFYTQLGLIFEYI